MSPGGSALSLLGGGEKQSRGTQHPVFEVYSRSSNQSNRQYLTHTPLQWRLLNLPNSKCVDERDRKSIEALDPLHINGHRGYVERDLFGKQFEELTL